jgi:hypothetical protein
MHPHDNVAIIANDGGLTAGPQEDNLRVFELAPPDSATSQTRYNN